jgi:hypothetical protein
VKQFALAAYSVRTFETCGGLHAHIVFVGNQAMIRGSFEDAPVGDLADQGPNGD